MAIGASFTSLGASGIISICPVQKEMMELIYFTADTHFGHENVIRFCDRPYSCAEEMDEALILNWNSRVKGNDTVYILGDMFFRSTRVERDVYKRQLGYGVLQRRRSSGYGDHLRAQQPHPVYVERLTDGILLEMCIRDRAISPAQRAAAP